MTTDSLDQLRQLTNIDKLKQNELAANAFRPDSRPVLEDFEADIKVSGPHTITGTRRDGGTYTNEVVRLACSNIITYKSRTPFEDNYFEIDIPLRERSGSALGKTIESLVALDESAKSIADLDGKRLHLKDTPFDTGDVETFTKRDGSQGSKPFVFWYYHVVEITGKSKAGPNGVKAIASQAAQEAALAYCVGKAEADLTSGNGIQEFIKYLNSQSLLEVPLQTEIVSRKFVARMFADGKLTEGAEGLLVLV